jgi:AcrR family transcriptional regulator
MARQKKHQDSALDEFSTDRSVGATLSGMSVSVNADSRRREIVTGAAELFDREGYHATNMNSVARAVGLQKPTLYHYFSSKNEILNWIHEEFIDLLIEKQEAREEQDLAPADDLRAVMRDVLELMDTHRGHVRVFFEHYRELSEVDQATIKQKRDRYQALVEGIVARGIASGAFRDVDVRLTTLALFGMCNWSYQWYRKGGSLESLGIADFFWDLLLNGFAAR